MDYDDELRLYNDALRDAYRIAPQDRVLDIGCGAGQTTRDAARLARNGWVLGIDTSKQMIERARALARAEGLENTTFEQADAAVYAFESGVFDLAISRFGTMFFADPVSAFANVSRALRPKGRIMMLVWESRERNEWAVEVDRCLEGSEDAWDPDGKGLDPFSLADPGSVEQILVEAGFADVTFTDLGRPIYYGMDITAALRWIRGFACTRTLLHRLDPAAARRALDCLRETIARHAHRDGVWFDSRAWIVEAGRR